MRSAKVAHGAANEERAIPGYEPLTPTLYGR
jgi:hypothetical protein